MIEQRSQYIELAPHCSLTPRGAAVFFAGLATISFGIAGLFAVQGFWPVLPFAGLEMLLLAWALRVSLARRHYVEAITISEDEVVFERRDGVRRSQVVFSRHWTHVKLRGPVSRLHASRLMLESHGRALEVGRFLTEEERHGLAVRLKRSIGRMNESPSLG